MLALGQRAHGKFLGPLHAEGARQLVVSLHEANRLFHGTSPLIVSMAHLVDIIYYM